jgi:hypothetical protein
MPPAAAGSSIKTLDRAEAVALTCLSSESGAVIEIEMTVTWPHWNTGAKPNRSGRLVAWRRNESLV